MEYPGVISEVKAIIKKIENKKFKNMYLIACGGSSALMYPSQFFIDTNAKNLTCEYLNANEFIYRNQAALGENSIVILCSQEGKTPETVAAAAYSREKGATVITIAMKENTPLQQAGGELFVRYGYYMTCRPIETSYGVMFMLAAGILQNLEGGSYFEDMIDSLVRLEPVMKEAKAGFEPFAADFAEKCKDDKIIYSLASGMNYSQAYVLCNCYLMEMQWINAIPIHAGEFFHGPFEIIEKNSPVIMLVGMDSTRYLEERAVKFLKQYTDRAFILDMNEIDYRDIKKEYIGYMSVLILNNECRMLVQKLSISRNHDLDIRRYMHLVEY
jgi:fructoselysine 6-phosphate deglycase